MKKLLNIALLIATVLSFSACGSDEKKDEPKNITQKDYEIFAGEKAVIQGTGLKGLTWESTDQFVANVDADAIIQAHKVGWTAITSDGVTGYLNVIVKPKVTIYSEPLIRQHCKWENNQLVVEDWHSQYIWGTHSSLLPYLIKESGLPWTLASNTSDLMTFKTGNTATPLVGYLFNKDGRMYGTGIYMNPLYASKLFDFLDERFIIYSVDKVNYIADFAHAKKDYNDEITINYIGQVQASESAGLIIIMYIADIDNVRSEIGFKDAFSKFELAVLE